MVLPWAEHVASALEGGSGEEEPSGGHSAKDLSDLRFQAPSFAVVVEDDRPPSGG